jgi:TolB-like protein
LVLSSVLVLSSFAQRAETAGRRGPKVRYNPGTTKVAVLAFVNGIGREGPEEKGACEASTERVRTAFGRRSFQVLDAKPVVEAVKSLKVDLADSEQRTKKTFQKIAEHLGARLVVCGVVLDYSAYMKEVFLRRRHGEAKVELKVYDAETGSYPLRVVHRGETRGSWSLPDAVSASGLQRAALEQAIDKALRDFLKPYPVVKKPEPAAGSAENR